LTRYFFRT